MNEKCEATKCVNDEPTLKEKIDKLNGTMQETDGLLNELMKFLFNEDSPENDTKSVDSMDSALSFALNMASVNKETLYCIMNRLGVAI